ncbi:hypothetical protein [Arthrobacter sp. Helios]|uniref:DoxX family protein n=1 Tax=Arthrobacter sp. Helios TaxID=2828862 RepID=UPI0020602CFF|nr:hypothetical protein [Arthrobacter sp. Helios]UPO76742.1 hypothetical protein ArtHe_15610 [Arthrobacter sp. Helios]
MNKQTASAAALAALLGISAANHFRNPGFYASVVPRTLCRDKSGRFGLLTRSQWISGSGVIEGVAAAGLLLPATRKAAATGTALMFTAFVAGHLGALERAFGERGSDRERIIHSLRLPLQLPLIRWAWSLRRS